MQNNDDQEGSIPGMKWGNAHIPKNAFIPPNFHIPRHMRDDAHLALLKLRFKPPKHMRKEGD